MEIEKKPSVLKNLIWRFAERIGAQGVKLIVELVLARILAPEDFGLIAIVTVFITLLNVFVDSGLGNALIQKKDADDLDFSSVFWFNIVWCAILYILLFFCSPLVATFYGKQILSPVLRVLGIQVLISGVKNVQQAYVSKTMQFKKFFFATLGGTIGAAVIGILMALYGFGIWALVAQQLFNLTVDTIILWATVDWRPHFVFSFTRLKKLISFGWKLLVSSLIDTLYSELRQLIIGKKYSSSDLAYFNRGEQFPRFFINNINTSIDSVLLPTMSEAQDDKQKVRAMTRKAIKICTYIISPFMIGLAFIGEPFVKLILGAKWIDCVFFMRVYCITFLFYPMHTANLNAIKALGRSDLYLKLEMIKKTIGLVALLISMNISVNAMAYSMLVVSILSQLVNTWPNKKLLDYSYFEQLKDILPSILLAVVMGGIVYPIVLLQYNSLLTIIVQVLLGMVIYFIGSMIFHMEGYEYVLNILKSIKNKYLHK